jgi:hypothetical protein
LRLREASNPLSIIIDLGHEPLSFSALYIPLETLFASLTTSHYCELPFLTTELQWHFSVPLDQRARRFQRLIIGREGRGSRSSSCLVVVVVLLFALLGRCGGAIKQRKAAAFRV